GQLVLPGDVGGRQAIRFFPWPAVDAFGEANMVQSDKQTHAGMLRERVDYSFDKVVNGFYKNPFLRFDRQIVRVDCQQPLNSWPPALHDMPPALPQLVPIFDYALLPPSPRLFSQVVVILLFAPTNAHHVHPR
uniref:YcjX family protein n=1 Tax=Salmonella enterica TaxID=28901 RepID=UPI00398C7A18